MSLDLMRRDPGSENGVMETMVAATVAAGPVIGVDRLSLNFAVMRAIFEEGAKIGAGPVMRFAWVPHVRQSLVAAGVPVSVQREVRTRLGAALPALRTLG